MMIRDSGLLFGLPCRYIEVKAHSLCTEMLLC